MLCSCSAPKGTSDLHFLSRGLASGQAVDLPSLLVPGSLDLGFKVSLSSFQGGGELAAVRSPTGEARPWSKARLVLPSFRSSEDSAHQTQVEQGAAVPGRASCPR